MIVVLYAPIVHAERTPVMDFTTRRRRIEAKPPAADLEPWRDRQPAVISTVMRGS